MKKTIYIMAIILVFALIFTPFGNATPNGICIIINEKLVESDVPPQIINGRTMVPLRLITEELGAKVEWDETEQAVHISFSNKKELPLLKLNGEATTWPYWIENGKLYLEYRNMLQLVREYYSHPNYVPSFFKSKNLLTINNKTIELSGQQKGEFYLVAIDELIKANIINYTWDEETGNLTLINY